MRMCLILTLSESSGWPCDGRRTGTSPVPTDGNPSEMIRDKKLVADFLESKGLRAEKFSKEEMTDSKTSDFRVFNGQDFAFYCEVKSMSRDEWLNKQLDAAKPGEIVGGGRPTPIYNRVSQKIHEAVKQFDAVNPDLVHPNVLVLVNHDKDSGVKDLDLVYSGGFFTEDGKWVPMFRKFSEGRIRDKKRRIHLYIWIDVFNGEPNDFRLHNLDSPEHLDRLCDYFGSDPASIRASRG